ncbi:unnamed protein product [Pichia kudriavzevii]
MSEVESIVRQIIQTSPAGDDTTIIKDIKTLLSNANSDRLISNVLRDHYTQEVKNIQDCGDMKLVRINGDYSIISNYNQKVIDIESGVPNELKDESVESLQEELEQYISEYYNESSYGMVIPHNDGIKVLIVGEKLNDANYYNGKWVSVYTLANDGRFSVVFKIKVHYYEDGNVVMNSVNEKEIGQSTKAQLINDVSRFDNEYELDIMKKINSLNEEKFKNLRRLMPISRAKIQWGRAIGNYKLGQDVAGGRH